MFIRYSKEERGSNSIREAVGPIFPFTIDSIRINFMYKNGFKRIVKIFLKSNPSDIEERILSAINWHGMAHNSYSIKEDKISPLSTTLVSSRRRSQDISKFSDTERFIKCMIALESLFIFNKSEPIRNNLAERVALLLGRDYLTRKQISDNMKKLYDLRSEIVHGGKITVDKKDLNLVFKLVQSSILVLIKSRGRLKIKNLNDFGNWFEKKKLTGN
jgi:hypothetical protein